MKSRSALISRRQLLAGAGAGAAALLLEPRGLQAQAPPSRTVVFTHTTVVNVDAVQDDVALAVAGDRIAAIGPTDTVLRTYPNADVYDGRGKALFPASSTVTRTWRRRSSAASTRTSDSPTPRAWPSGPPACFRAKRPR